MYEHKLLKNGRSKKALRKKKAQKGRAEESFMQKTLLKSVFFVGILTVLLPKFFTLQFK
jgi:cytoskeletal protein RodZ